METWRNFKGNKWKEGIDVRDFILNNYKEYTGDDHFLAGVSKKTEKVLTNADRIRGMNDEELAEFLCKIRSCDSDGHPCDGCTAEKYCQPGHIGMLAYLKKSAKEGRVWNG